MDLPRPRGGGVQTKHYLQRTTPVQNKISSQINRQVSCLKSLLTGTGTGTGTGCIFIIYERMN